MNRFRLDFKCFSQDRVYGDPKWYRLPDCRCIHKTAWNFVECPNGHSNLRARTAPVDVELSGPLRNGQTLIWSDEGSSTLFLTEEAKEIFECNNLTGYNLVEAKVVRYRRKQTNLVDLPRLWELRVTTWVPMDRFLSGYQLEEPPCEFCGRSRFRKSKNGIWLAEDPDLDFVVAREYPLFLLVSEKVKNLIVSNQLLPCGLVPQANIGFDGVSPS